MPMVTPFVGVWIETYYGMKILVPTKVTPFVGVWIETLLSGKSATSHTVTPFVGVWIETLKYLRVADNAVSHPSWVCGLKHQPT